MKAAKVLTPVKRNWDLGDLVLKEIRAWEQNHGMGFFAALELVASVALFAGLIAYGAEIPWARFLATAALGQFLFTHGIAGLRRRTWAITLNGVFALVLILMILQVPFKPYSDIPAFLWDLGIRVALIFQLSRWVKIGWNTFRNKNKSGDASTESISA